jgi:nucleotide-binding universal stress UspA family protein
MPNRTPPEKEEVEAPSTRPAEPPELTIKTILAPSDLSEASMRALQVAIPIAERFRADLHLLYVHEGDADFSVDAMSQMLHESAEMRTHRKKEPGRVSLLRVENSHVLIGRAYLKVCDLARELKADLIVLATRGNTGLTRVLLGSTAEKIVQFAPCPVLVTRQRKDQTEQKNAKKASPACLEFSPHTILVPVDFSQNSVAGLKYAARFATTFGARLHLFHAIFPANPLVLDRISANLSGELDETRRVNAQMEMEALMSLAFMRGVPCQTAIRRGYAIQEICDEIDRADIDLVITSTHGETGFKHALVGSVAEHIVRYATCPVLVVPSTSRVG